MRDTEASVRERTWAQVDLDALRHNYEAVRATLRPGVKLCCVVKANAYGHGACKLAPLYERWGADWFAVSNMQEALQLRRYGVTRPVLILGYSAPECAGLLAEHGLSQCVYSAEYGRQLSRQAVAAGVTVKMHIKLDTGMGRLGFPCATPEEALTAADTVWEVCRLPGLFPEGIFTHFASADEGEEGEAFSRRQYACFVAAVEDIARRGITFPLRHLANSAALADYPDFQLDMVRAGIVLYGVQPSGVLHSPLSLRPAMSLYSVISHVKTVPAGTPLSYGRTYVAPGEMQVATVPIGYADGFLRRNGEAGVMLTVAGQPVPIVGRVCMDQLLVDVTGMALTVGDRVAVFGTAPALTAAQLAEKTGTIAYEIICGVGERVPRLFIENDRVVDALEIVTLTGEECKRGSGG